MTSEQKPPSDQDLLRRAGDGDSSAFGDLYERYLEPIYQYVLYRLSSVEEAEDLTETIFLKAWENIRTKGNADQIENVRAWLYRIAHNLAVDYHRKKRPVSMDMHEQIDLTDQSAPSAEETVQARLSDHNLQTAVKALDEQSREIIVLRFFNGLSHAEVAGVLDLNEGHIRVLQYRALSRLKGILGEEPDD